ncbi:hypothetical protein GCM10009827_087300 [Dactylosporangium maewongense]|uniref:HEAT repeat protein n=2 Tax=Dactylosporangium maewongense TaxID=634393 RepID=A0ABN2C9D4_9ACTN
MPDAATVLSDTDWPALEHATGLATELPAVLVRLLDDDASARTEALRYLDRINHGNSIYPATAPAAVYLATILPDPRTVAPVTIDHRGVVGPRPLRVVLLDWLGDMADDVGNEVAVLALKYGDDLRDAPAVVALGAARPTIFRVVASFVDDGDPAVRAAAVVAAGRLTDDPSLLGFRTELAIRLRAVLDNDADGDHRAVRDGYSPTGTGLYQSPRRPIRTGTDQTRSTHPRSDSRRGRQPAARPTANDIALLATPRRALRRTRRA